MYARFTLDSVTEFLFGDCVNSLYEPLLLPGGVETPRYGSLIPETASSSAFVRPFGITQAQEVITTRLRIGLLLRLSRTDEGVSSTACGTGLERRRELQSEGLGQKKESKGGIVTWFLGLKT